MVSFGMLTVELGRYDFTITEINFAAKPMREQKALFYAAAMPLKILSIHGPAFHGPTFHGPTFHGS